MHSNAPYARLTTIAGLYSMSQTFGLETKVLVSSGRCNPHAQFLTVIYRVCGQCCEEKSSSPWLTLYNTPPGDPPR